MCRHGACRQRMWCRRIIHGPPPQLLPRHRRRRIRHQILQAPRCRNSCHSRRRCYCRRRPRVMRHKIVHMVRMCAWRVRRLGLYHVAEGYRGVQLRPLAGRGALCGLRIVFTFVSSSPSTFWSESGVEGTERHVFFQRDAIPSVLGVRVLGWGYLYMVGVLLPKKVFEKSIDMHRAHPSLRRVSEVV